MPGNDISSLLHGSLTFVPAGESTPVTKGEGGEVIGGSINSERALEVEVENTGEESYLSKVITMVRESQKAKSKTQGLPDKAAFWLTLIAITVGILTLRYQFLRLLP